MPATKHRWTEHGTARNGAVVVDPREAGRWIERAGPGRYRVVCRACARGWEFGALDQALGAFRRHLRGHELV